MNLWGKKNSSRWSADYKNKKENHITINNDMGTIISDLMKEIIEIGKTLKDINASLKVALIKIENLEKRVEKLENERKLYK